jgi:stage V sporulation protein AE
MEYLYSFLIGGTFCIIAQILIDKTKLTPARILVGYVVIGVILSAVGIYEPLVRFASSGATTPLTGFGHLLAKATKSAVDDKGLLGALTGGLTGTAGGITAAIFFGYIFALIFRGKSK